MRTILTDIDMFVTKAGGPSGVLWLVITSVQIKSIGFRHWWRWGLGMGIYIKDDLDALEQKGKEIIDEIIDDINPAAEID